MPDTPNEWRRDEYHALALEWRRGDPRVAARLEEIERERWELQLRVAPELAPFSTTAEAVEEAARRLGIPFPTQAELPHTTDHLKRLRFCIGTAKRSVQVWPPARSGKGYLVHLFDYALAGFPDGAYYSGTAPSLEEAARAARGWIVDRAELPAWMDPRPREVLPGW